MPNYELEYKKLTQIIEFQSRKIERVLDIGANIGQSSYTFRKIFPNAEIHAFEPNPLIFEVLRKNLKKSKIQVYNFGLGQVNSASKIYIPEYKSVLFTGLGSCSQKQAENYLKRNIIGELIKNFGYDKDQSNTIAEFYCDEKYDIYKKILLSL